MSETMDVDKSQESLQEPEASHGTTSLIGQIRDSLATSPHEALVRMRSLVQASSQPETASQNAEDEDDSGRILFPDATPESRKHPLIEDVPTYDFARLLESIDTPEAVAAHSIKLLGSGAYGIVLGLQNRKESVAVKIMHYQLPAERMLSLLDTIKPKDGTADEDAYFGATYYYKNIPPQERPNDDPAVLSEIIARREAYAINPDSVPHLNGMITLDGQLAGYVMEEVEGEALGTNDINQEVRKQADILMQKGLRVDWGGGGAIRRPNGTICFVDVSLSGENPTLEQARNAVLEQWRENS